MSHINFLARRQPPNKATEQLIKSHPDKLSRFISTDPPSTWSTHIRSATPKPEVFFSSLATTRANAGGFDKQYALEHDANIELARAAKDAGTKVYVLISAGGANSRSSLPYVRMKGEIEKDVLDLGFEKTVIVRPGMLLGDRGETRMLEAPVAAIAKSLGWISKPLLRDPWAQDGQEVARASVSAAMAALKGTGEEGQQKVRYLSAKDIIRLGRTEWKES